MKDEMSDKFDKVEQIKDDLNTKKQKLIEDEKSLGQLKDKISPTINNSDYEVNIAEKKYQMHDQFSVYNANERKLAELEGKRYYLKHYINTKSKDINYEDIKNECMSYADELNKTLVKWLSTLSSVSSYQVIFMGVFLYGYCFFFILNIV